MNRRIKVLQTFALPLGYRAGWKAIVAKYPVWGSQVKYSRVVSTPLDRILDSADPSLFDVPSKARGPAGSLPITPEMLLKRPSGDTFGWAQNAGMGWDPATLGRQRVSDPQHPRRNPRRRWHPGRARLPHRTLGGRPADGGGRQGTQSAGRHPVRRVLHRPVRRPHAGHHRACSTACPTATTPPPSSAA